MSKVQELQSLEAAQQRLEAEVARNAQRIDVLRSELKEHNDLVEMVRSEAAAKNINLTDLAIALVPSLGKKSQVSAQNADGKIRRARKVKQYKNPHNGEILETKGGNHKTLKHWKDKWGADVVEGWATTL